MDNHEHRWWCTLLSPSPAGCPCAANTAISVLDYSRKESINSVVIAHDGNIEKAIPATVIEEEEQKKDISEF